MNKTKIIITGLTLLSVLCSCSSKKKDGTSTSTDNSVDSIISNDHNDETSDNSSFPITSYTREPGYVYCSLNNKVDWNEVYIYAWNNDSGELDEDITTFGKAKMEYVSPMDMYKYYIGEDIQNCNIVFSNKGQTIDLTYNTNYPLFTFDGGKELSGEDNSLSCYTGVWTDINRNITPIDNTISINYYYKADFDNYEKRELVKETDSIYKISNISCANSEGKIYVFKETTIQYSDNSTKKEIEKIFYSSDLDYVPCVNKIYNLTLDLSQQEYHQIVLQEVSNVQSYSQYYIVGTFTNWEKDETKCLVSTSSSNVYTITISLSQNDEFKIIDKNYTKEYKTIDEASSYAALTDYNSIMILESGTYAISFDDMTGKINVTK